MSINGFSIFMAIVLFTVGGTICSLFLLRTKSRNLWIIGLVMILCLLRCVVPLEFDGILTINIWEIYPDVFSLLKKEVYPNLSIGSLLCLAWLISTVFLLCKQGYELSKQHNYTKFIVTACPKDPRVDEIAIRAADAVGCNKPVDVHIAPNLPTSIMTGYFRPIIALSKYDADRSEPEIEYILRHEIAHYMGGDTWYKLLVQIMICVMWWNPAIYLFRKSLYQLFELRCDSRACRSLSDEARGDYAAVLIDVLNRQNGMPGMPQSIGFVGLHTSKYTKHRVKMLLSPPATGKSPLLNVLITCLCVGLYVGSYTFIVQPAALPPEPDGTDFLFPTADNSYLVPIENGQFEVWVDGNYFMTITAEIVKTEPFNQFPIKEKE